jgi:probable phosphoglycerate mutase
MTTFALVRHVPHALQGKSLIGRTPGVGLSPEGRAMLGRLAERFAGADIEAVYCSPPERTVETARALAERLGLTVEVAPELNEIDYGDWTGRTFAEIADDPRWIAWNTFRSGTRLPGAETIIEIQARVLRLVERLRERHPDGRVLLVSHGDPIRAVLLHFLGMSTDFIHRLEVDPGSVSVLAIGDAGPCLLKLNDTGHLF